MDISDADWKLVVEAFERGRRAEEDRLLPGEELVTAPEKIFRCMLPLDEKQVRRELRQLRRHLEKLSLETLLEIEVPIVQAVDEAIRTMAIPLVDTHRPQKYAYNEAVAVLKPLWKGSTARGRRRNQYKGGYGFNPFVTWLGGNLKKLDPKRLKTPEAACLAAWNALSNAPTQS